MIGTEQAPTGAPRSRPLTRAALLQLLHCQGVPWWRQVLHAAQQRLHEAGPVGRADAYVVAWLVLEPLLASGVQAHEDRSAAAGGGGAVTAGAGGRPWGEGVPCLGNEVGTGDRGVLLTWTCCSAGFPLRGPWPGKSFVCAHTSGLGANETEPEPGSRCPWELVLGPWRVQRARGVGGEVRATPGSSCRHSSWAVSRYLWRFQLRLGLNMSWAAALASSPTQKVSQEA